MKTALKQAEEPQDGDIVALLEFTQHGSLMGPEEERRCYVVKKCDDVRIQSHMSANPYWHSRQQWQESDNLSQYEPFEEAVLRVTDISGSYVGHWNTMEEVHHFITFYMRGTDIEALMLEEV